MPEEDKKIWNPDNLKGNTFEGTITDARIEKKVQQSSGQEKEYVVLPTAVSFTEKPFNISMTLSDKKNSLFGEFLRALKQCKVTIQSEKDLIGAKFLFERKDIDFGSFKVEDFPLPIEFLGKEKADIKK